MAPGQGWSLIFLCEAVSAYMSSSGGPGQFGQERPGLDCAGPTWRRQARQKKVSVEDRSTSLFAFVERLAKTLSGGILKDTFGAA